MNGYKSKFWENPEISEKIGKSYQNFSTGLKSEVQKKTLCSYNRGAELEYPNRGAAYRGAELQFHPPWRRNTNSLCYLVQNLASLRNSRILTYRSLPTIGMVFECWV